ncbi:MAG: DUF4838 domain-containing protein [Armatimonadota bacterium]
MGLARLVSIVGLLMLVSASGFSASNSLRQDWLVINGRSQLSVVVRSDAGDVVKLAVDDLVRCLGSALGVEVPQVVDPRDVRTRFSILVGSSFARERGIDLARLHRDGCVIKTCGSSLVIAGASEFGTANGVYTFLIDWLGVRWFAPGELYEVIPRRADLTFPALNITRNPDFSYRVFSGVTGDAGRRWLMRSRLDYDTSNMPYYGFGHNLSRIVKPSVYGRDHPEYFPMVKGRRLVPQIDDPSGPQVCFTNPEVIRIAVEAANEFFRQNPDRTTFSLGINDSDVFCECPGCTALDQPERRSPHGWVVHSDSYFYFVNEVAKRIKQIHPDKYLGCFAYWGVELPPRSIEKLPDNVVIALTQDTSQHFDHVYKRTDRELWQAWSRVASHLGKYDYYGLGWLTPRYFPHLAADDLKFIHNNSAVGLYCEVYPNWSVTAPQLYVTARLLWDCSLDVDKLLDEYFESLYGNAASEMKRFYALLEQYWARPRPGRWFEGLENMDKELAIVDADLIEQAWKHLFKARTMVIGVYADRVADVQEHFRFTYEIVRGYNLARQIAEARIGSRPDVAKIVSQIESALDSIRLARKVHQEKWLANPLYKHTYYTGQRFEKKFHTWENRVAESINAAISNIVEFGRSKLPGDELTIILTDLRSRLSSDPDARRLRLLDAITTDN